MAPSRDQRHVGAVEVDGAGPGLLQRLLLLAELAGMEDLHLVASAGAFGNLARGSLTDRSVESIDVVWELVAFLLTAFVFLLVGVAISPANLIHALGPIAVAIAGVLVARAVVVYGLLGATSRVAGVFVSRRRGPVPERGAATGPTLGPIPTTWLHVLFWAGLRGAVSVALALRLQIEKSFPCQLCLPVQIAPETLLRFLHEMLEMLRDRCYFRHAGVRLLS